MCSMRNHKDVGSEEFSARLRRACQERGHTSARNQSGIDVSAVAAAGRCSYEMARRYVAGLAIPNDATMRLLAEWLRVPVGWLAFGDAGNSTGGTPVSAVELEACLVAIEEAQKLAGVTLPPARVAALAAALYREATEGRPVTAGVLAASLRALS